MLGCEGLVMGWLWQQQQHGGARSGISTSIPPQRQRGVVGLRGSRRPCAGTDPAALLILPVSPASSVTGLGRAGAGGSGAAPAHSILGMEVEAYGSWGWRWDAFPLAGGAGPQEAVLHHEVCSEDSLLSCPFLLEAAIG